MSTIYRAGKSQELTTGAASVASAAFSGTITKVRLVATAACLVTFGSAPTAAAGTSMRLAPNFPEHFLVRPGEKVAVIQDTASGKLNITELN